MSQQLRDILSVAEFVDLLAVHIALGHRDLFSGSNPDDRNRVLDRGGPFEPDLQFQTLSRYLERVAQRSVIGVDDAQLPLARRKRKLEVSLLVAGHGLPPLDLNAGCRHRFVRGGEDHSLYPNRRLRHGPGWRQGNKRHGESETDSSSDGEPEPDTSREK